MAATLSPLGAHSLQSINPTISGTGATDALLSSFLSNNIPQTHSFQQTVNSHTKGTGKSSQLLGALLPSMNTSGPNGLLTTRGQLQEQNQELLGASTLKAIPDFAQNVNTLLASSASNNTQGQTTVKDTKENPAKRAKLSTDSTDDDAV